MVKLSIVRVHRPESAANDNADPLPPAAEKKAA